jgi:hypothetical protein
LVAASIMACARGVLAHPGSARSAKNRSSFAVVLAMRSLALAMASDIVKAPFLAGLQACSLRRKADLGPLSATRHKTRRAFSFRAVPDRAWQATRPREFQ